MVRVKVVTHTQPVEGSAATVLVHAGGEAEAEQIGVDGERTRWFFDLDPARARRAQQKEDGTLDQHQRQAYQAAFDAHRER